MQPDWLLDSIDGVERAGALARREISASIESLE